MANNGLWVGILTALTALAASFLTSRATFRAALAQARTNTRAEALRAQHERRRSSYLEMMNCVHAFNQVTWQIDDVGAAPDSESAKRILSRMHQRIGPAIADMNKAMHEVRLDGPAEVSAAADLVRNGARHVQSALKAFAEDDSSERRDAYDTAYRHFREAYLTFIGLARAALEVQDSEPVMPRLLKRR